MILSLFLCLLHFLISPAQGFFPTQWKSDIFGLGAVSHIQMTDRAFKNRAAAYFPLVSPITHKMIKARDEIGRANAAVDTDNAEIAHYHCDGETFPAAQRHITKLTQEIVDHLRKEQPSDARRKVGVALHAIQDFYSHSNWIELGNRHTNTDLIRGNPISFASWTTRTCRDCEVSHPLWSSDWNLCKKWDCRHNTDFFTELTSGYYWGQDVPPRNVPMPSHKCMHGGLSDSPVGAKLGTVLGIPMRGINKDSLSCQWSPHYFHHTAAARVATEATKEYFDHIKAALNNEHHLRLLFGVGPTLAFAIDTTGSMEDIIAGVVQQTIDLAESRFNTPEEPGIYVVSPFNDPDIGPLTVTSDFNVFKRTVLGLTAGGGGDCPELAVSAMLNATEVMEEESTLFMFTDNEAKDAAYAGNLKAIARAKKINVYPYQYETDCVDEPLKLKPRQEFVPGSVYEDIAVATGGQYRRGPRAEVANLSSILDSVITGESSTILRVVDTLACSQTFEVPVDSYMTKVSFLFRGGNASMTISQPDSKPLDLAGTGVTRTVLSDSTFVSIVKPAHGVYKVTLAGTGDYSLTCTGISPLFLSSFSFASIRGRPGHDGWYPISGPPPSNHRIGALAEITGHFESADFSFRAPSYSLITSVPMIAGSGEEGFPAANSFINILDVPQQRFSVYVAGVDGNGNRYQRTLNSDFMPEPSNSTYLLGGNQSLAATGTAATGTSATAVPTHTETGPGCPSPNISMTTPGVIPGGPGYNPDSATSLDFVTTPGVILGNASTTMANSSTTGGSLTSSTSTSTSVSTTVMSVLGSSASGPLRIHVACSLLAFLVFLIWPIL